MNKAGICRKTMALLLTLIMLLSMMPTGVFADDAEATPAPSPSPSTELTTEQTTKQTTTQTTETSEKSAPDALSAGGAAFVAAVAAINRADTLAAAQAALDAPEDEGASAAWAAADAAIGSALDLYEEVPDAELNDERVKSANTDIIGLVAAIRALTPSLPQAAPMVTGLAFIGVADAFGDPGTTFDAMDGVSATIDDAPADVVITNITSTDTAYVFTPGATTIALSAVDYTAYTVTYNAYATTDTARLTPLGAAATRVITAHTPSVYAPGTITFQADGGISSTATTYDLLADTHGTFTVRYVPNAAGTSNTVLVINWPEYGADIETIPTSAISGVADAVRIDSHTLAIKLNNGSMEEFTIDIKLKTVPLTDAQAAEWMDNGALPATGMKVTEYNLPDGPVLSAVLTAGTAYTTVTNSSVVPASYTGKLTNVGNYDVKIPSVGEMTNRGLTRAGANVNPSYPAIATGDCALSYSIPSVHAGGDAGLVEITGMKIYCPDEKLELTSVNGFSGSTNGARLYWNDWTIGERQTETTGPNADKSYYILTPPARIFNTTNFTRLGVTYTALIRPTWQLVDINDELGYAADAYTVYQAPNTELLYREPGDTENRSLSHTGPVVTTFARKTTPVIDHAYINSRDNRGAGTTRPDVITASVHSDGLFSWTSNSWQTKTVNNFVTEYTPSYTGGPITQSYDFPLEIAPTTLRLDDHNQIPAFADNAMPNGRRSSLRSISYTLVDGTVVSATPEEVAAVNTQFASKTAINYEYSLASATEANPVKNVTLVWDKLYTEYHEGYSSIPYYNMAYSPYQFNGSLYTIGVKFDYRVGEYHDLAKTDPVLDMETAWVTYTFTAAGNTDASATESNANYLFFRLRTPECPDLCSNWQDGESSISRDANIPQTFKTGQIGFTIGSYGARKDDIEDPVIDLWAKFRRNNYTYAEDSNLLGMTEAEGLAFLTGKFTAMPKMSGWKITYTTKDGNDGNVTVPQITNKNGETYQIPLADGDCFTSLQLSFDGTVSLPHSSENDSTTIIWLMNDIEMRTLNTNPFTSERLNTKTDFSAFVVAIDGEMHTANCACNDADHTRTDTHSGQKMQAREFGRTPYYYPQHMMYFTRKATLYMSSSDVPTAVKTIFQGESFADTFKIGVNTTGSSESNSSNPIYAFTLDPGVSLSDSNGADAASYSFMFLPWGINEAAYVELTDPEIMVDLNTTTFYGIPATDPNVLTSTVTAGGRTFLKLQFAEGYIRSTGYDRYFANAHQYYKKAFLVNPGYICFYKTSGILSGPIKLGFTSLPGTTVGIHNPVGDIYLDFSELLDKYDAPNITGFDNNRTEYVFQNAVTDELGLSDSVTTEAKLFQVDASAYAVNIVRATTVGADIIPGKQQSFYDFVSRVTAFDPDLREDLNALVPLQAPLQNPIYDMTTYVKIPRVNAPIQWLDDAKNVQTSTSQYNMYLDAAPSILGSAKMTDLTANNITYAYTTDPNPTESSTYTTSAPTTAAGWRAVTGIRIAIKSMPAESSLNLRLELSADEKTQVGSTLAYGGGSYKYRASSGETTYDTGLLPRAAWRYEDYALLLPDAIVFWDIYNEDGLMSGTGERGVAKVTVKLYTPDGALIDTAVSGTGGKFTLRSFSRQAGQYLELTLPTAADTAITGGVDTRITLQSAAGPTESGTDSDFDRATNRLVLPAVPLGGFQKISVGLVKLPKLTAADVTVEAGQTVDVTALLTEYFGATLPTDSYNVTFNEAADTTIADVAEGEQEVTGTAATATRTTGVTGVKPGTTTATVTTTNTLGDVITITYNITVTTSYSNIQADKEWDDNNNALGARPAGVTFQLQRKIAGGTAENVGAAVTVSGPIWSHTFTHMPDYDPTGAEYIYSVVETAVPNYTTAYTEDGATGALIVTNTLKTISLDGVKTWSELSTGFVRPASITLSLNRNGTAMTGAAYTKTVSAASADPNDSHRWLYSFDDLLEFDPATGDPYDYTVTEASFGAVGETDPGFNYSVDENGMNVANMYPAKLYFTVIKEWEHGDLAGSGNEPTSAVIALYRNGVPFTGELTSGGVITLDGTVDAKETTAWQCTFQVNQTDAEGGARFTIVETPIPGYVTTVGPAVVDTANTTRISFTVTNTYTPTPVDYTPSVEKAIDGTLPAGAPARDFTFTLTSDVNGQPMPGGSTATSVRQTVTGAGAVAFADITFTEAGVYTYTITEQDKSAQTGYKGYTFDAAEYTMTVNVSDPAGDGTLVATARYSGPDGDIGDSLAVTNTYEPLPVDYAIGVNKTISGDTAVLSETFDFTLTGAVGTEPLPADAGNTASITGAGRANFSAITFTAPGTYTYNITETEPAAADRVEGYTYNTTPVTVDITVEDVNGQLVATPSVANADIAIDNTFTTPVITVSGTKTWNGWQAGETKPTATINLWQNNAAPMEGETPYAATTIANGATSYSFADVPKFDDAGAEIVYTVTETAMTGVDSERAANGRDFVNTKLTPDVINSTELNIVKTIAGNDLPTAKAFTFTIEQAADDAVAAVMPANTSVTTGAITAGSATAVGFGDITFIAAGEYHFTVTETASGVTNMTDAEAQDVTVTVTENNFILTATVADGELEFTNTYDPADATITAADLNVTKTLAGNTLLTPTRFVFDLALTTGEAANVTMPVTTATTAAISTGSAAPVSFGTITFTAAGDYTFTISEEESGITNMQDAADQTVTVRVTDNGGALQAAIIDPVAGGALTFTNTYDPTDAVITDTDLTVTKTVSGNALPTASAFAFTIAQDAADPIAATMPVVRSTTTAAITTGSADPVGWDDITFEKPGTYHFTIEEANPGIAGMTNAAAQNVTVRVVDNAGTLEATITAPTTGGALTFVNTYDPTDATITNAALNVTKTIAGNDLTTATAFSFTIGLRTGTAANVQMPTVTVITTDAISTGSADPVGWGDITFTAAGDYVFTITETNPGITGMNNAVAQDVTVSVTDNGAGVLTANITSAAGGALEFTNTYDPTDASITDTDLNVISTIEGGELPDPTGFDYTITLDPTVTDGVTMPGTTGISSPDEISTGSTTAAGWDDIVFTKPGTYTFTVTQDDPGIPGLTSPAPITVTIEVTDEGGRLEAAVTGPVTGGALEFTNTYDPVDATITDAALNVTKTIAGNDLLTATAFEFTIALTAGTAANVTMPTPLTTSTSAVSTGSADPVGWGDITFAAAGDYTFTITETDPNITNMTNAPAQSVTVRVTDDGSGTLTASIPAGGALEFTNTYDPADATVTDADLTVSSTVDGGTLPTATDFDYTLVLDTGDPDGVTLPNVRSITSPDEITTGSTTPVGFDDLVFTKPGTYTFTVTQTDPNVPGLTAPAPVTVTIEVTDNGGTLTADIIGLTGGAVEFVNTYNTTAAVITSAALNVTKTIAGDALTAARTFTFTIAQDAADAVRAVMPTNVSATSAAIATGSAAPVGFGDITFNSAGTYHFTVTETATGVNRMADAAPQSVTVVVTDNASVLTARIATPTAGGALTFTNTYTPTAVVAADPPVRKAITGDTPATDDTFNFTMTAVSYTAPAGSTLTIAARDMPMPAGSISGVKMASVVGEGAVEFGDYTYAHAGTYVYRIAETAGRNALYTYDNTVYTITDTVIDTNGALSYTRAISGGVTECLITNTYTQPNGELSISKTVSGDLASKTQDFTFTLTINARGTFNYTGSKTGTISNGGTFTLKHGESITISLPAGTTYTVAESGNNGYQVTSTGTSGVITANGTVGAAFTNTKSSVPKTGDDETVRYGVATMILSFSGMGGLLLTNGIMRNKRKKNSK